MRLILADDHTLFREALVEYIKRAIPEAEVITAKDFFEAFKILEKDQNFDLVLLDLQMPGMRGLDGLDWMIEGFPDIPVALISGVAEEQDVRSAMEMGAVAYFPKTMSGKAMVQAFQMVMDGERFMPLDQKGSSIMPSYHPATYARPEKFNDDTATYFAATYTGVQEEQEKIENGDDHKALTPREKDVLSFLAKGASNKEIARELALQIVTVKLHVRGICRKLGVQNRTQAALKAQHIAL